MCCFYVFQEYTAYSNHRQSGFSWTHHTEPEAGLRDRSELKKKQTNKTRFIGRQGVAGRKSEIRDKGERFPNQTGSIGNVNEKNKSIMKQGQTLHKVDGVRVYL